MPGVDDWRPTRRGRYRDKWRDHASGYNPQTVINWVGVGHLDDMIHKVEAAGGDIVGERLTKPGVGDTIYAKDTEGNTFGMIQPVPRIPRCSRSRGSPAPTEAGAQPGQCVPYPRG